MTNGGLRCIINLGTFRGFLIGAGLTGTWHGPGMGPAWTWHGPGTALSQPYAWPYALCARTYARVSVMFMHVVLRENVRSLKNSHVRIPSIAINIHKGHSFLTKSPIK